MTVHIRQKLLNIQSALKVPKSQFNSFGKYNYRNCEDILEALKPLCVSHNVVLTIDDKIELVSDRVYIKSTATLRDAENVEQYIEVSAFAREPLEKKGMDSGQLTGSTSSYARKYALSGLFGIDDNKDPDHSGASNPRQAEKQTKPETKDPQVKATKTGAKKKTYASLDFLKEMTIIKERLNKVTGDDKKYYDILGQCGYVKSNEIPPDRQLSALKFFNTLMEDQGEDRKG